MLFCLIDSIIIANKRGFIAINLDTKMINTQRQKLLIVDYTSYTPLWHSLKARGCLNGMIYHITLFGYYPILGNRLKT
jgi:hypothetical protein